MEWKEIKQNKTQYLLKLYECINIYVSFVITSQLWITT